MRPPACLLRRLEQLEGSPRHVDASAASPAGSWQVTPHLPQLTRRLGGKTPTPFAHRHTPCTLLCRHTRARHPLSSYTGQMCFLGPPPTRLQTLSDPATACNGVQGQLLICLPACWYVVARRGPAAAGLAARLPPTNARAAAQDKAFPKVPLGGTQTTSAAAITSAVVLVLPTSRCMQHQLPNPPRVSHARLQATGIKDPKERCCTLYRDEGEGELQQVSHRALDQPGMCPSCHCGITTHTCR
jgi:hypothetical protein